MTDEPPDHRSAADVVKQLTGVIPVEERRSDDVTIKMPAPFADIVMPKALLERLPDPSWVRDAILSNSVKADPRTDEDLIERDRLLYGTGFGRLRGDGSIEHIPAQTVVVFTTPRENK
jgi:hypothetical protein